MPGVAPIYVFSHDVCVVVGIQEACLKFLIVGVEDVEHVPADEFVVAVDGHGDGVVAAVVVDGVVDVFECSRPLVAFDVDVLVRGNVVEVEVLAVGEVAAVVGGVVDDYGEVVRVILTENRVQVVLNTHVEIVVVGANDEAHRQLFLVLIEVIEIVESVVLDLLLVFLKVVHRLVQLQVVLYEVYAEEVGLVFYKLDTLLVEGLSPLLVAGFWI